MFHRFTLVLLLVLSWLPQAGARDDAPHPHVRLYGVVKDSTGAVIVGAEVLLSTPTFHSTQLTDRDGRFVFERVPASDRGRIFLRGSSLGETRKNGTPLQNNRTTIREVDLGGDWRSTRVGAFSLVAYAGRQVFNQTFSAIALDRNRFPRCRATSSPSRAATPGLPC